MAFHPTQDRVLVKQFNPEERTQSGFFIPQTSQEQMNQGTVISTGPGRTTDRGVLLPPVVKAGDTIMYEPHGGVPVKVDGESLVVMREDSIIAIVDPVSSH